MVSKTKVIRPNSLPVIPESEVGTLPHSKHTQDLLNTLPAQSRSRSQCQIQTFLHGFNIFFSPFETQIGFSINPNTDTHLRRLNNHELCAAADYKSDSVLLRGYKSKARTNRPIQTPSQRLRESTHLLEAGNVQVEDEIVVIRTARSAADMVPCHLPPWRTTGITHTHTHKSHMLPFGLQVYAYMRLFYCGHQNAGLDIAAYCDDKIGWEACVENRLGWQQKRKNSGRENYFMSPGFLNKHKLCFVRSGREHLQKAQIP